MEKYNQRNCDGHLRNQSTQSVEMCPVGIVDRYNGALLPTAYEVWRKVLFSKACFIHSVHGGGGVVGWVSDQGSLPFFNIFHGGLPIFHHFRGGGG